jgi:hypothetical protein
MDNWDNSNEYARRVKTTNGNCCFNHIIGLPRKNGEEKPLFDYQRQLYYSLFNPSYINYRPPTPEERIKYNQLMIDTERDKINSKNENVKKAHQDVLARKTKELIWDFKRKHLWA